MRAMALWLGSLIRCFEQLFEGGRLRSCRPDDRHQPEDGVSQRDRQDYCENVRYCHRLSWLAPTEANRCA
jgi:hypothetical protein